MKIAHKLSFIFLICTAFAVIFLFSAKTGTVAVDFQDFLKAILHPNEENLARVLIWEIRIPRFFSSLLCGGCLAISGQLLQVLVRNPLADPFTLGTGSGAALALNLSITGVVPPLLSGFYFMPFWAFIGAFGAGLLVMMIAENQRSQSSERLLLAGVAVSILCNSLISFLLYFRADGNEIRQMVFWAFGSLDKSSWSLLLPVSIVMIPGIIFSIAGSRTWNLMLLGDEKSSSLGHSPYRIRRNILILSSFLTACVVCLAGPIGFVGLVVPYFVRSFIPLGQKGQIFLTFLCGAFFLSVCDLLPRFFTFRSGIPTGLISSLIGLPLFLYLLRKSGHKANADS